ncbi:MAG: sulfatase-like hydrolase/transferase, partial [Candidatus Poribacteria bacterium]|nr:sulfatase-like hydrolase/transferase [Candidatus Poribacteria bacterium]
PGPLFRPSDIEAQQRLSAINFQTQSTDPQEFNGKLYQAQYWAMVELIDENVGQMMTALEATGQRENTIVIFTSDHGDMTGDHGLRLKGCRFYEALVRVPLIISWPEKFQSGLRTEALVELTDLVPTLLEATDQPISDRIQGQSLWTILTGKKDPNHHRDFVRSEYYQALPKTPSHATMIRDQRYKLVNYHGHQLGELFDLERDPHEFDNCWDDPNYADIRFHLMKQNFDALAAAVDIGTPRLSGF